MDASMDDDVFEPTAPPPPQQGMIKTTPITGYRTYQPPQDAVTLSKSNVLHDVETVTHKVILLGDSGVGKTSLLVKFDTGRFESGKFAATVGIGFTSKVMEIEGAKVKLQIWDTAGQERFRCVTHAYYRDAHALLLLYDVTNKKSYDNIRAWLGEIRDYAQDDVVIMLIGNKADCLGGTRAIRREEGDRLAREYNVVFIETSAKSGQNVDLAFHAIARKLKDVDRNEALKDTDTNRFNVEDYLKAHSHDDGSGGGAQCPPCT